MNRKCTKCQHVFEVSSEVSIQFCPYCGEKIEQDCPASPGNAIQADKCICPVCSSEIQPTDEKIMCPDCKMSYHKDCWNDNNGCATYGCKSAGCLNPPPMKIDVTDFSNDSDQKSIAASSPMQESESIECPFCHTKLAEGTQMCWSCGKDISNIGNFIETNGFNFSRLNKLSNALKFFGILSLVLGIIVKGIDIMSETNDELINNPICIILFLLVLIASFVTNIVWIILWKSMKKSIASVITLGFILFALFFAGYTLGYLFLFATTSQVDTIIKNKGRVQITFWGVKPIE